MMMTADLKCVECGARVPLGLIPTTEKVDHMTNTVTVTLEVNDVEYATHVCEGR